MSEIVRCSNCGAPMSPTADGRTFACPYCTAAKQVAVDGEQIALGLKLDLSNTDAFLARLAKALGVGLLAQKLKVHAEGTLILVLELHLDPDVFIARRDQQVVIAQHKKLVRGVALKTKTLPLDRWVALLSEKLARHYNTSAEAAQALSWLKEDM